MLYGLISALSIFMRLMNNDLRIFINRFVIVYFDDILIYCKSLDDHIKTLCYVLNVLRNAKLYASIMKCIFCLKKVIFFLDIFFYKYHMSLFLLIIVNTLTYMVVRDVIMSSKDAI